MEIKQIFSNDKLWQKLIVYGKNCSWKAGPYFAKQMEDNIFTEWERVYVAIDGNSMDFHYCGNGTDQVFNTGKNNRQNTKQRQFCRE